MEKDFDAWNELKKSIEDITFNDFVNEKEVWWGALGANIGSEEDGKNDFFERPVLILRKFNKDMVLVIPFTSKVKPNPYYFPITICGNEVSLLISQLRVFSTKRLIKKFSVVTDMTFQEIREYTIQLLFPTKGIPAQRSRDS